MFSPIKRKINDDFYHEGVVAFEKFGNADEGIVEEWTGFFIAAVYHNNEIKIDFQFDEQEQRDEFVRGWKAAEKIITPCFS